ncbi:MAG TPA: hypothetical protein VGF38_24225 [Ktedonobacterales bacterium]
MPPYLLVLANFTVLYLLAGAGILAFGLLATQLHQMAWYEAIVLSIAGFHGCGQSPGALFVILASLEAIFNLFIEVSFFTRRFFGK